MTNLEIVAMKANYTELKKENERLKKEIDEMEFCYAMESIERDNKYDFTEVLNCFNFKKYHHIMMADGYLLSMFIEVVDTYGYERVNNYMIKRLEQENSEDTEDEEF